MIKFMRVAAGAVAAGVLLAGCGSSEAAVGGDTAPTAGVDRAALNTGDFPTTPQPPYGTADPDKTVAIESQRMAEFTTLPFEVDPEITESFGSSKPVTDPKVLKDSFSEPGAAIVGESLVAGYMTSAKTPSGEREFSQIVLRLTDDAAAASAAERIHTSLVTTDNGGVGAQTAEKIDILPNSFVSSRESADFTTKKPVVTVKGFTAHGNYLLYSSARVPGTEKDSTARTIAKALELQEPLIDQFPATPVDQIKDIKMDQDDVLIYTVGRPDGALATQEMAVYGPRGISQLANDQFADASRLYKVLDDTNTDRVAVYDSYVYRSESPESAQKLLDGLVTANLDQEGWTKAPSPAGLPNAQCTTNGTSDACWVAGGRYVGQSTSGTKTDVDQRISAQYLILDGAK
ncbi:hypothetical protein SAMN04490239_0750 [Rhodococcus koreensis]|uniref:Uncharacterized protein n=2 Tax=Rhodococcus koreensis TaxID=99653 RepID=A0A1H4IJT4_9NOCA|nr:hypothetical protein SAMN04490239_0750 [Rhodococcus koreensis]